MDEFGLRGLPERTRKPRTNGLTMVMDKGISVREAEDFLSVGGEYADIMKLGFGTGMLTPTLRTKLNLYRDAGMAVYFGGTLFEAYIVRGQFDDYLAMMERFGITHVEVSDGSLEMPHEEKCALISRLSANATVYSEVGSKDMEKILAPYQWIELMQRELDAGSSMVIAEARETGNVGIYRTSGEVRQGLVNEILTKIPAERILWEAPQKMQQVWFIELLGQNVNLGNIAPDDVIPLETLRLGLRGDTFSLFQPKP